MIRSGGFSVSLPFSPPSPLPPPHLFPESALEKVVGASGIAVSDDDMIWSAVASLSHSLLLLPFLSAPTPEFALEKVVSASGIALSDDDMIWSAVASLSHSLLLLLPFLSAPTPESALEKVADLDKVVRRVTPRLCIAPLLTSFQPPPPPSPPYPPQADLAKVDRRVTPWLVVMFHEAWYHSNKEHHLSGEAMRVALEKTLYDARTDVVVCGHVHSYERTVSWGQGWEGKGEHERTASVRHLRRCLALEQLLYDARTDVVVCGHVHASERTASWRAETGRWGRCCMPGLMWFVDTTCTLTVSSSVSPRLTVSSSVSPRLTVSSSVSPRLTVSSSVSPRLTVSSSVSPRLTVSSSVSPRLTVSSSVSPRLTVSSSVSPRLTMSSSVSPRLTVSSSVSPRPLLSLVATPVLLSIRIVCSAPSSPQPVPCCIPPLHPTAASHRCIPLLHPTAASHCCCCTLLPQYQWMNLNTSAYFAVARSSHNISG
ncbi:unnamed protein product [Closterium sp. Yama58-4]|nr:unnamed protein product [Closterium sp. Yama58-4]